MVNVKLFWIVLLLLVVFGGGYVLTRLSQRMVAKDTSYAPAYISGKGHSDANQISDTPSVAVSPLVADPTRTGGLSVLLAISHTLSQISWGREESDSMNILGKMYSGTSISGTYASSTAGVSDFGEKSSLLSDGWSVDTRLAAGGANGNAWGYMMDKEAGKELLYFSYTNVSFTPPPGETKCPCTFQVKVFHSDSF